MFSAKSPSQVYHSLPWIESHSMGLWNDVFLQVFLILQVHTVTSRKQLDVIWPFFSAKSSVSIFAQKCLRTWKDAYFSLQNKYLCIYKDTFATKICRDDCALRAFVFYTQINIHFFYQKARILFFLHMFLAEQLLRSFLELKAIGSSTGLRRDALGVFPGPFWVTLGAAAAGAAAA